MFTLAAASDHYLFPLLVMPDVAITVFARTSVIGAPEEAQMLV
jgi:hypothetical protein